MLAPVNSTSPQSMSSNYEPSPKKDTIMKFLRQSSIGSFLAIALLPIAVSVISSPASASEAGPNGSNIGLDFTWNDAINPGGHSASFLETDGITANNCSGGTLAATTKTCNFVFDYRVDGAVQASTSHAARWITWSNPTSYSDGKPVATGCSSPTNGAGDLGKAPLTLFDCFNSGSLGQVFRPNASGALTQFRMSMTCLVPSGSAKYDLYALLYELNPEGTTLTGSAPIGATLVNLSKCPTATTWRNKMFTATDFSMMPISFTNASVIAGKFYGVYLTGSGVPGTLPPGAATAMAAAKAITTTTTVPPTTTTTTPWSRFKSENNKTPTSSPGTTVAPATVPATSELTVLGASRTNLSAVRLMSPTMAKKYYINSMTPKVCLGAGRNLVFIHTGRCAARVQLRSNGKLISTVTTKVASGTVVTSDEVVAIAPATMVYFKSGTGLTTAASKRAIGSLVPTAKVADAVLVIGHTGNLQSENSNLIPLSQKRASAARSLLRDGGVRTTIAIWSSGASSPITKGATEREQDLNRRAEIFIVP